MFWPPLSPALVRAPGGYRRPQEDLHHGLHYAGSVLFRVCCGRHRPGVFPDALHTGPDLGRHDHLRSDNGGGYHPLPAAGRPGLLRHDNDAGHVPGPRHRPSGISAVRLLRDYLELLLLCLAGAGIASLIRVPRSPVQEPVYETPKRYWTVLCCAWAFRWR